MNDVKLTVSCLMLMSILVLAACDGPLVESTQVGYRGTGMADIQDPNGPAGPIGYPEALPPASADGPKAGEVYQNVQVLGDLSVGQFTRLMTSITAWVSPEQGCNYCHNPQNLASDDMYTKVVSRRMIQMNQTINTSWNNHVGANGVNCYTCHRGKNVPEYIWFTEGDSTFGNSPFAGWRDGQNRPVESVAYSTLPSDPLTRYLSGPDSESSRLASAGPYPTGDGLTTKESEWSYALMMNWSSSLGVNCTYCHMTASFQSWEQSTPARVTAYHGQSMVRALNADYLTPLGPVYPDYRLGPAEGDAPKAYCATCHQGQKQPLGGDDAVSDYPALAVKN
jgi:photosynthetic reaction center cytochrome c subunit